jgi:D-alanyl-D-alanine carboxypeptidase-like protein/MacB-like protein
VRRTAALAAAAVGGAVVGAALVLALPVPGLPHRPGTGPTPAAVLGRAPVPTLLAWTPGGLPRGYAAAVRHLPSVRAVAAIRSGVAWMSEWRDPSGRRDRPPRGFRVPVEVAAIRSRTYARFLPPADRALVRRPDSVVLGRTFADLHGLGPGSVLVVDGIRLAVDGVLDDELVGAHEVVVTVPTGTRLGVVRSRYVLVAPAPGITSARVESGLARLVPPGLRVRVRAPGETPVFRHGDAVLPPVRLKEIFGEFAAAPRPDGTLALDPSWVRANIRTAHVPVLGEVRCHRLVVPLIRGALEDLARRGLGHLVDPGDYGGCFFPRFIARDAGSGISHHTWGVAIDINVSQGLPGRQPSIDPRVVDAFEDWGFKWGGDFLVPDGTHFEFIRFPA